MKFCNCGSMFNLYDDIENRILYYKCNSCELTQEFGEKLVFSKSITLEKNNWKKYDKTLPVSDKICFRCKKNTVVYEKRPDLTLVYTCNSCNEEWS